MNLRFLFPFALIVISLLAAALQAAPHLAVATHLGGGGTGYLEDHVYDMVVDSAGRPCVVGYTGSPHFPFTNTRYKPPGADRGAFVARFSPDGSSLEFSTHIPGCHLRGIAMDGQGNFWVVGRTLGDGFILTNAVQTRFGGGATDAVVLKLSAEGDQVMHASYLGGESVDLARRVVVDDQGNAYVAGWTTSVRFPVTAGAFQTEHGGGFDAFVVKINSEGSRVEYSTYLGGARADTALGIVLDARRRLTVTGLTGSSVFGVATVPRRIGQGSGQDRDAYVARLDPLGSSLDLFTTLGGKGNEAGAALALTSSGDIVVFGQTTSTNFPTLRALQPVKAGAARAGDDTTDPRSSGLVDHFLSVLDSDGTELRYSTYFGGSSSEDSADLEPYINEELGLVFAEAGAVAVAQDGGIWITGFTSSTDLPGSALVPAPAGGAEGYVARLDVSRSQVDFLAYLGASGDESSRSLRLDQAGNAWVAGSTGFPIQPPYFPSSLRSYQPEYRGSVTDGFLARFDAATKRAENDAFGGREAMRGTRLTLLPNFEGATAEPLEPAHGDAPAFRSLWWSWTAPTNGSAFFSIEGSPSGIALEVYRGSSLSTLERQGGGAGQSIRVPVTAGQELFIALDAKRPELNSARLSLTFSSPLNDSVTARTVLSGLPVFSTGSNVDATYERGAGVQDPTIGGRSVWWGWTASESGNVAVSTLGSSFDTELSILGAQEQGGLDVLDINNDHEGSLWSQVTFRAEQGKTYLVCVDGIRGESGSIQLALTPATPPPNDSFAGRLEIPGLVASIVATNQFATLETGDPSRNLLGFDSEASSTMWWTWTSPSNGLVRISTAGSTFDTRLAVLTGMALENLQLIQASDNHPRAGGQASLVEFNATAGTVYQVLVEAGPYDRRGVLRLQLRLSLPSRIVPETIRLASDGLLAFEADGLPGTDYLVEMSSDLREWRAIPSEPLRGPRIRFAGANAAPAAARYFRVIELP